MRDSDVGSAILANLRREQTNDMLATIMIDPQAPRRQQTRLPRYWLGRGMFLLQVLVGFVAVSWYEPRSMSAVAIDAAGPVGWFLVLAMAAGCLVGLADVIVNDLLPERFELPTAKNWRHIGLGLIGLSLAAMAFVIAFSAGFSILVLAYWMNAGFALALMLLDVFARLRRS